MLRDGKIDDHYRHLVNTTSCKLGLQTTVSGHFRIDPPSPLVYIRKRIDSELVRVLAEKMIYSEGVSEETLENELFTGVKRVKKTNKQRW